MLYVLMKTREGKDAIPAKKKKKHTGSGGQSD